MSVSFMNLGASLRNQSNPSMGTFIDNFNSYYEHEFGYLYNIFSEDQDGKDMPIA